MSYPLRTAAAVTALGLAGAAVWTFSGGSSDADTKRSTVALGRIANIALTTEHDCPDLLAYYRTEATRVVGPYGLDGDIRLFAMEDAGSVAKGVAPNASESSRSAASSGSVADSTTNVQVAGVDESDVVKTDGDLMVAVVNGEVRITRLAGADTKTLATWRPAEGAAQSILLDGGMAVVIGDRNGGIPLGARKMVPSSDGYNAALTDLTVLDLADPAHPRPVRRLELSGARAGEARLVDGELRLALTAGATGIAWKAPVYQDPQDSDPKKAEAKFKISEKRALAANKRLAAESTIGNWIPQATVTALNAKGKPEGSADSRPLLDCEQVAIPGSFSGLRTLALVSLDLHADSPLSSWRSAGVIADGSTVYSTADHTWVATSRWDAFPVDGPTSTVSRFAPSPAYTQIHRFDTPLRAQPRYIASGQIAGSLLNQFSMDEKDGQLRVASTTDGVAGPSAGTAERASGLTDGTTGAGVASDDSTTSSGGTGTQAAAGTAASPGTVVGTTASPGTAASTGTATVGTPAPPATGGSTPGSTGGGSTGSTATDVATPSAIEPATPLPSISAPKPGRSEARVTVLKVDGDSLVQVGVVTGLGVGEHIRGVRFIGDVGYVVTYQQTDPLYTVDLSDPAHPRVRGELEVLGYSAYLHPAGDGRLLGLGQDGTAAGRQTGLQLSLFDVRNLDSPRRLDRERLANAWSDAESDHHAFTMAGDLVLIPYSLWESEPRKGGSPSETDMDGGWLERFDAGVIAVRVGADGLGSPTTLRPIANGPITFVGDRGAYSKVQRTTEAIPMRTVVHDGTIYTLTQTGVAAHSATTFDRLTFAKF